MQNKIQDNLDLALKHLTIADHMAYVTFPLVNEKKLLLKIFEETYKSIINSIISIINYEKKEAGTWDEEDENMKKLFEISRKYNINEEEIVKIMEIIEINKKHKNSAIEFVRRDKVVIMLDSLKVISLDIRKIKEYIIVAKHFFIKVNMAINDKA